MNPASNNKDQKPEEEASESSLKLQTVVSAAESDPVQVRKEGKQESMGLKCSAGEDSRLEASVFDEPEEEKEEDEDCGRERLKRHRIEMAGRVWIPEIWGQESLLKDWIDCTAFDRSLVPNGLRSARAALVEEGRRANSGGMRLENRC